MNEDNDKIVKHNVGGELGVIETDATLEFTAEMAERLRQGTLAPEITPSVEVAEASKKEQAKKESLKKFKLK